MSIISNSDVQTLDGQMTIFDFPEYLPNAKKTEVCVNNSFDILVKRERTMKGLNENK